MCKLYKHERNNLTFFIGFVKLSYSQCAELPIDKFIQGDPIFLLSEGDMVEICEDDKTISFGTKTFYIIDVKGYTGNFTYNFKLDNVYYSPKFGQLTVYPKTHIMAITLTSGQTGGYSYISKEVAENKQKDVDKKNAEEVNNRLAMDRTSYALIDISLEEGNFELMNSKINKLYYPQNYPRYNEFLKFQKEFLSEKDLKTIDSIKLNLNKGDINRAIEQYSRLSVPDSNIKNLIQTAINSNTKEELKAIPSDLLDKIIKDNSSSFNNITEGNYSLILNKEGIVSILDSTKSNPKQICINKSYLIVDGFEFPINYEGKVIISLEYSRNNLQDSTRYIFAEKYKRKDLYVSVKGFYYAGKFGAPLSAKIVDKPQFISTKAGKNEVLIENLYLAQKKQMEY